MAKKKYRITLDVEIEEITGAIPIDPPPVDPPTVPGKDIEKIGVNAFTWTPPVMLEKFRNVRLYISTDFICTEKGLFVEPIYKSRSDIGEGLDSYLADRKRIGGTATLCINQSPAFMQGATTAAAPLTKKQAQAVRYKRASQMDANMTLSANVPDAPPCLPGADRTDPKSYAAFADIMGQLAKRYGKVKHPDSALRVDTSSRWTNDGPNVKKTGLDYPIVLEVWNEPEKWWIKGTPTYFFPAEYAAMLLACWREIKAADKDMPVAMAGLTNFDLGYLIAMDQFFIAHNSGVWPCDIINVHHYSNIRNEYGKHPPTWSDGGGCAPADDKDFTRINDVVKFARDRGKKVWVSEFGYDTRPPSWQYITPRDGKTAEQLQGIYLVETYKAYIAAGVDCCFMFNGNDEPGAPNGGLWQNSGLLYGEGEAGKKWQGKPAYDAVLKYMSELK